MTHLGDSVSVVEAREINDLYVQIHMSFRFQLEYPLCNFKESAEFFLKDWERTLGGLPYQQAMYGWAFIEECLAGLLTVLREQQDLLKVDTRPWTHYLNMTAMYLKCFPQKVEAVVLPDVQVQAIAAVMSEWRDRLSSLWGTLIQHLNTMVAQERCPAYAYEAATHQMQVGLLDPNFLEQFVAGLVTAHDQLQQLNVTDVRRETYRRLLLDGDLSPRQVDELLLQCRSRVR